MEQLKPNQSSRCGFDGPLNNRAVPGLPMLTSQSCTPNHPNLPHIKTSSPLPYSTQTRKSTLPSQPSHRTRKSSNTVTGVCHVIHPTYSGALRNKGNSVYYKRTSVRSHPHLQQEQKYIRNNWIKHHAWNERVLREQVHIKKVFKKIKNAVLQSTTQAALQNRSQHTLTQSEHPLEEQGVIYAIIHMPTSAIYVGQTINSAYSRLKLHWQTRFTDDFRNHGLHSKMRSSASIQEYIIWPLEIIDPTLYIINGTRYHNKFRNFASVRERDWIVRLRTLRPKGFNISLPFVQKEFCRRSPEPNTTIEENFVKVMDNRLVINTTSAGPTLRIRQLFNRLLDLKSDENLNHELKQLSKQLRINLLSWSYAQIPTAFNDTQVTKIQSTIRDLNKRPTTIAKSDKIVTSTFIKIVHIHEAIQYASIRSILRRPQLSRLLPGNNGTKNDNVPMICDKQTLPSSTLLCNFSMVAKNLSPLCSIMPPASTCPCRTVLLPSCTDLVDGHVMSTNYDYIRNEELRRQFYYGSVFKNNVDSTAILESISLGIDDYIARISKLPNQLTTQEASNLKEWKQLVLRSCEQNLNQHTSKFKSNSQRGADAISHLKLLREHFTITKVDKLTHNLAFTCKQYYQYKLYSELFSDAYSPATNNFDEIIHRHQSFNAKYKYRHVSTLPYLYGIPKLHKNPPKLRYIAGVSSPIE